MRLWSVWLSAAVYLALHNARTTAAGQAGRHLLHLNAGTLDIGLVSSRTEIRGQRRLLSSEPRTSKLWGPFRGQQQYILAFNTSRSTEDSDDLKSFLDREGAWLGGYLPDDAVLVLASHSVVSLLQDLPAAKWIGEFLPAYKTGLGAEDLLSRCSLGQIDRAEFAVSFLAPHRPNEDRPQDYNPASAALEDWTPYMRTRNWQATVKPVNKHTVTVLVACRDVQEVLDWIKHESAVHWIAPSNPTARLHNWQGSAVVQSSRAAPNAPVPVSEDQGTHPIWAAGITGTGQIIGGGDSGLDWRNCYFDDPSIDWNASTTTDRISGVTSFSSTSHRKIRLYRAESNGIGSSGHGTHTMSSLLGSPLNTSDLYQMNYRGMAPDAKLAFIDLAGQSADTIYTPQDLATDYYNYAYDVGARVHSDSWGSASTGYDYLAAQVDLFTWQHQDFLPVLAAGNEGATLANASGVETVTSPATSKNCIAAGATEVAGQSFITNPQYITASMTIHQPNGTQTADTAVESYLVMQSGFGPNLTMLYAQQLPLSVSEPRDACSSLTNGNSVNGTVVLIQRGSCLLSNKVAIAQASGAISAIVYDNSINDYFLMLADSGSAASIYIPSASIPRQIGQLLISSILAGGQLRVSFGAPSTSPEAWANLAAFSSKGPTSDGRVKPDLLAPGTLQSAYTDTVTGNSCAFRTMQGTSMATPLIAGSAALVRQYLLSGAYPTGKANAANVFKPSGALVKAILIGGAAGLSGYEPDTGLPLAPPPSYRQGFGRASLANSLPLQGSAMSMQLVDMANITDGESHHYCINATGGALTITLVWHDYPAALSASKALVNDLDLTVRAAGLNGIPLLGNGGENGDLMSPDRTNNVEQVTLSNVPPGKVAIQVDGYNVYYGQGPQPYAMVVLGNFQGTLASPFNPVGGNVSSGDCQVAIAEILGGPAALTNSQIISFNFSLQGKPDVVGSFECALQKDSGQNATSPNYEACASPMSYPSLEDGAYIFSVRAQGERIADTSRFVKDTEPPKLTFQDAFPANNKSAAEIANFTFSAEDDDLAFFMCRVNATGKLTTQRTIRALQPNGPISSIPINLGLWANCTSPISLYWITEGSWSLEVSATDEAGNTVQQPLQYGWKAAYELNKQYARFAAAPLGPVSEANLSLTIQSCVGSKSGLQCSSATSSMSCYLGKGAPQSANWSTAKVDALGTNDSAWQSCDGVLGDLDNGPYSLAARIDLNSTRDTVAYTEFELDSEAPLIEITKAPGSVVATSSVTVEFNASKPVSYMCAFSSSEVLDIQNGSVNWQTCQSPQHLTNLSNTEYTFFVTGEDRVGNQAEVQELDFLVDTIAPTISNLVYPVASQSDRVILTFTASDGPSGSGIANIQCRLQLLESANGSNALDSSAAFDWKTCQSPVVLNQLSQGLWDVSLMSVDHAGNKQTYGDIGLWIENAPSAVTVSQGPLQTAPVPPSVSFNITALSISGLGTPIQEARCRLVQISDADAADRKLSNSSVSLPGPVMKPSASGFRSPASQFQQQVGSPAATSAMPATFTPEMQANLTAYEVSNDSVAPQPAADPSLLLQTYATTTGLQDWAPCQNPVAFQGLATGNYSFQAYVIDAAGNVGNVSQNYMFAVNSRLQPDGSVQAAFWGLGWKFWLIIGGGSALVLVVCLAVFAVGLRFCRTSTRQARHHYTAHQNTVNTPRIGGTALATDSATAHRNALQNASAPPMPMPAPEPDSYHASETLPHSRPSSFLDNSEQRHSTAVLRGNLSNERLQRGGSSGISELISLSQTPRFDSDATAKALRESLDLHRSLSSMTPTGTPRMVAEDDPVEEARIRQAIVSSLLRTQSPRMHPLMPPLGLDLLDSRTSSLDSHRSSEGDERALLASHRNRQTPRLSRLQEASRPSR